MRILGIDPGTLRTGFGIIDVLGNRLHYVTSGIIRLKEKDMNTRLDIIFDNLQQIIEQYRPEQMAIEEVFFAKNPQSAIKLGQARGVAIVAATRAQLPVAEYSTRLVKKTIVGTGAATKQQVNYMVQKLLTLPARPTEDASDALAMALCHYQFLQNTNVTMIK